MRELEVILQTEEENESFIYLYNIDGGWCAFERSAFIATLMFSKSEIKEGKYTCIIEGKKAILPMVEIKAGVLFSQDLKSISDHEIKLPFSVRVGKFKYWKAQMKKKYF